MNKTNRELAFFLTAVVNFRLATSLNTTVKGILRSICDFDSWIVL